MDNALPLLEYWYCALHSELGVRVPTNDPKQLVARLYTLRKAAGDPSLDDLTIVREPLGRAEIWILKKEILNAYKQ